MMLHGIQLDDYWDLTCLQMTMPFQIVHTLYAYNGPLARMVHSITTFVTRGKKTGYNTLCAT